MRDDIEGTFATDSKILTEHLPLEKMLQRKEYSNGAIGNNEGFGSDTIFGIRI